MKSNRVCPISLNKLFLKTLTFLEDTVFSESLFQRLLTLFSKKFCLAPVATCIRSFLLCPRVVVQSAGASMDLVGH